MSDPHYKSCEAEGCDGNTYFRYGFVKYCSNECVKRVAAAYNRARYKRNPEKIKAESRAWHRKNPGKAVAANKAWRKRNPEKEAAANKAWREKNRERSNIARRAYGRTPNGFASSLFKSAKRGAKIRGLEFTITKDEVKELLKSATTCPILGVKLDIKAGLRADNLPSLDRIDNTKGYTLDNVWIISWRANHLKNSATMEEMKLLAPAYVRITK